MLYGIMYETCPFVYETGAYVIKNNLEQPIRWNMTVPTITQVWRPIAVFSFVHYIWYEILTMKMFMVPHMTFKYHSRSPCTMYVAPFFLFLLYFYQSPPSVCSWQLVVDCLICCIIMYIHQCLGVLLWSTEVSTEGLLLLFGAPFSIVRSVVVCTYVDIVLMNTRRDGWISNGTVE